MMIEIMRWNPGKYGKTIERLGIDDSALIQAFDRILEQVTELLREINQVFISADVSSDTTT